MPPKYSVGSQEWLNEVFTYHAATPTQIEQYGKVREAAKVLVNAIQENSPRCADQSAAIRHVREAVMTANAAIALHGLV